MTPEMKELIRCIEITINFLEKVRGDTRYLKFFQKTPSGGYRLERMFLTYTINTLERYLEVLKDNE